MGVTDKIEAFINELMRQQDTDEEWLEIGRNELASIFGCVPSQINYVITTRFSPERGYAVQSRRGGGGCIRIRRICVNSDIKTLNGQIGTSVSESAARLLLDSLYGNGVIDKCLHDVIAAAVSDNSIPLHNPQKNEIRALILKNALAAVEQ